MLPAIRAKWSFSVGVENVIIQHDNATPHKVVDETILQAAAIEEGFSCEWDFQPPNSSDMNVLDLEFFRAIQSLQHQEDPNTIDELVAAVEKSFDNIVTHYAR